MSWVPSHAARPGVPAGEATEGDPQLRMVPFLGLWKPLTHGCGGSLVLQSHCQKPGALPAQANASASGASLLSPLLPQGGVFRHDSSAETEHIQPMPHLTRMPPKAQGRWLGDLNQGWCCWTSSGASGMALECGHCPASSHPSFCHLLCTSGPLCAVGCSGNATCKVGLY